MQGSASTGNLKAGREVHIDSEIFQRVLGEELRDLRRRRGWTRKELNEHLQSDISLQTLATYELGTRQCSVLRLVELCLAMDELPAELLARVHRRVFIDEPGKVRVDLIKIVGDHQPELFSLRRWAEDRLRQPGSPHEVQLDRSAVARMAELCDLSPGELVDRLKALESG